MLEATLEDFGRDPVGRYVSDATYVHFCARPSLWGVLLWGRPTSSDARRLGRSLVYELAPPAEPHVSIVDASRLESGDDGAFRALEHYVLHYGELLSQWVKRLAVVRPRGLFGAVVAGAYEVIHRPYPVAVFDDALLALEWLDLPGDAPAVSPRAMVTTLSELYDSATGTPRLVQSLRGLLDSRLAGLTLRDASRALGVSSRSLQRKLLSAGTTYQAEMTGARVRASMRLLEGDAALTAIALDSGFASPQSFNAAFRRSTGISPSAWRQRRREERG